MKWEDVTSYSQGEKDRTPRSFQCQASWLRIKVHRHMDYPGKWLLSTVPSLFDSDVLSAADIDVAKSEALERVRVSLQKVLDSL